jgi:two-component system, OmpR family, response regulator
MHGSAGICEDDDELRGVLRRSLEHEGLAVRATASGTEAVRAFAEDPPDVLVLDVGLPDADGRDVCQALRARGVTSPVLFLTARAALPDRLSGFHAGGDDYLTKPFHFAELVARVRALLKRTGAGTAAVVGDVTLDPVTHSLRCGDEDVSLTPTEFRVLAALFAAPGAVVRCRELVAAAWPDGAIVHDNTLDQYVARLRRKLRAAGSEAAIETAHGVGYRLR